MSGEGTAEVALCPTGKPAEDIPRFWLYGGPGPLLVCQWCDANLVRVEGEIDFADLMEAVVTHIGGADRAREQSRAMLAGLAPGNTGVNLADEVADRVIAAFLGTAP